MTAVDGSTLALSGTNSKDCYKQLAENGNICVAGDYNISFCDNYYYTNDGRNSILKTFSDEKISIITADVPSCIDHIAISQDIVSEKTITIDEWNIDKRLTDHKGIVVNINRGV